MSTTTSSRPGIECPNCGHGTHVGKTINWTSWIQRVRTCNNAKCRHSFDTVEKPSDPGEQRKDLFSD